MEHLFDGSFWCPSNIHLKQKQGYKGEEETMPHENMRAISYALLALQPQGSKIRHPKV